MRKTIRHHTFEYPVRDFASKSEWTAYAKWLRRHMKVCLGLLPEPPRTPLKARVFGAWKGDGFTCEKVAFESLPGLLVTGNLWRPTKQNRRDRKNPGILSPHGHWDDGRQHDRDERCSIPARCIQLARMGATVFNWDTIGCGDSAQLGSRLFAHGKNAKFPRDEQWGFNAMALQPWDFILALDFLIALPEVDLKRIAIVAASGGAEQGFILGGVDDRIAAAALVCMTSYSLQGDCPCGNAPLLRIDATSVEFTRLLAPKPLFLGSCTGDWTRLTPTRELPAVRQIYRFYNAANCLSHRQVDAPHNFGRELREGAYGFCNRWLFAGRSVRPVREFYEGLMRPPLRERLVWWGRKAPERIPLTDLMSYWRKRQQNALRPYLKDAATARKHLGPLLSHILAMTPTSLEEFRGTKPRTVNITADRNALVVTLRKVPPYSAPGVRHFTTYNRPLLSDRVHEVLAGVEATGGGVKLTGTGPAGAVCLLAGAVSKRVASLDVDMCGFEPSNDKHWAKYFDAPAIRQVGGLASVFAMIGPRPLKLRNASDRIRKLARKYTR